MANFSFGASAQPDPTQPQLPPLTAGSKPVMHPHAPGGFDINAYIQTMMQMAHQQQQGRLQQQREASGGRHLDMSGNDIQQSNPFGGPMHFNQSASDLSPQALAQSQGSTAMNQWNFGMQGSRPPTESNSAAAMHASPQPFQISPESAALVHGYGNPAMQPSGLPQLPTNPQMLQRQPLQKAPMGSPMGRSFSFGAGSNAQ